MRSSLLAGLLAVGTAHAFSDASPFLLFSTAEFPSQQQPTEQLQTSSRVLSTAKDILGACPTTKYLLVSQPNVHASDLYGPAGCRAHRLSKAITSDDVHGLFTVAQVVANDAGVDGNMSFDAFSSYIKKSCLANKDQEASLKELSLVPLPASEDCKDRAEEMDDNDYVLGSILQEELAKGDYTVVFFSPAHEGKSYEADFEHQSHLKKRLVPEQVARIETLRRQASTGSSKSDQAPLFVKYQFFTPAIFMGLLALFVILSITYVGLVSLSSLEVSYGAFDKEMGPTAQKKQA